MNIRCGSVLNRNGVFHHCTKAVHEDNQHFDAESRQHWVGYEVPRADPIPTEQKLVFRSPCGGHSAKFMSQNRLVQGEEYVIKSSYADADGEVFVSIRGLNHYLSMSSFILA